MSKSNRSNRANREAQVISVGEVGSIEEAGILAVQVEASDVPDPDGWDFAGTSNEVETDAVETPVVEEAVVEVEVPAAPVEEEVVEVPVTAAAIEFLPGLTPAIASAALSPPAPEKKERKKRKMGRPFYAAKVLREHGGLNVDLESLISKVDEECGKPNRTESLAWLKIAVQVCSGWEEAKKS